MENNLFLVESGVQYKEQFLTMVSQYKSSGEADYYDMYMEALEGFEQYVQKLQDYAKGINIPEDWVPYHTYWLINTGGEVLGVIRLRTSMENEYVQKYAGHIGYDISPLNRKRGNGREILRLGLDKARLLKMERVLITCNNDNEGSIRIIESNGGVFESEIFKESENKMLNRYWINL